MRTQFQILVFMACLNLTTGMVIELNLAGTEYVQASSPSNVTEYPEHFNATEVAKSWESEPFSGIPIVGDIFSMFQAFVRTFLYLIAGFPMFLGWIGDTFIVDASAKVAYSTVVGVLYAVFSISMTVLFIEFIAGRYFTE